MTNMKKLSIVLAVFCIGLFTHVQAQVPAEIVKATTKALVSCGIKSTPQLEQAVSRYYIQVIRKEGPIQPGWTENFVLEHAKKFVSVRTDLFTPVQAAKLKKQLTQKITSQQRPGALPLERVLEQNVRQATMGEKVTISVPDHMITGEQIINQFVPHWRQDLFGLFTNAQLDAVEKAFISTDKQFFEVAGEKVTYIPGGKWNYEEQFVIELRAILEEKGLSLTERQWKFIFGGAGIKVAPLAIPLKMLSTECYVAAYGKIPSQAESDGVVKSLGSWNNRFKYKREESKDPFVQGYVEFLNDNTKINHTPQENLAELQVFLEKGGELSTSPSAPGCKFYRVYKRYQEGLEAGTYTHEGEEATETARLGTDKKEGRYTEKEKEAAQDFVKLFEENWERQNHTPQENLAKLQAFLDEGGEVSASNSAPGLRFYNTYQRYQKGLEAGTYTGKEKKIAQAFVELFDKHWERQLHTPQENLAELKTFLETGRKLSTNQFAPDFRFYNTCQRYKKGLEADIYTGEEKMAAQSFVELFEKHWERLRHTPPDNLADLKTFLETGGKLSTNPSAPGRRFYQTYRRYKKGLKAGKYTGDEEGAVEDFVKLFEKNWQIK